MSILTATLVSMLRYRQILKKFTAKSKNGLPGFSSNSDNLQTIQPRFLKDAMFPVKRIVI